MLKVFMRANRPTILLRHGVPQVLILEHKRHRAVAWSSLVRPLWNANYRLEYDPLL